MSRQILKDALRKATALAQMFSQHNVIDTFSDPIHNIVGPSTSKFQSISEEGFVSHTTHVLSCVNVSTLQIELPALFSLDYMYAPVFYANVYESQFIHTCIFGFRRKGDNLPLHNHPGMHGFVKVIRGSASITSYSWLSPEEEIFERGKHIVRSVYDTPVRYEGTTVRTAEQECIHLGPMIGNIHCISALEDGTAFFDLLVPGYGDKPCSYYKVQPLDHLSASGSVCFLTQIPMPRTYYCETIPYQEIERL